MKRVRVILRSVSIILLQSFILQQISFADVIKPVVQNPLSRAEVSLELPETVATIEDAYNANQSTSAPAHQKTIYLLQDAHTNESAQYNLAKALDIILKKENSSSESGVRSSEKTSFTHSELRTPSSELKFVFTEAGIGDNSLSFLRPFRPLSERTRLAKMYTKKGILHGAEYLDLTSDHSFILWGVENPDLYLKTIEDYKHVAKERPRFELYLKKIAATLDTLNNRFLNPSLQQFLKESKLYHSDKLALTEYFQALQREATIHNLDLKKYPHLTKLKDLKDKEEKIDFQKANEQHQKAVQSLSPKAQQELKDISSVKAGKVLQNKKEERAYFQYLEEMLGHQSTSAPEHQNYTELNKYFSYLKLAKAIQAKDILSELKAFEIDVFKALAKTEDEKSLIQSEETLRYLNKLFTFTLTPEEFGVMSSEFGANKGLEHLTGFLNKKIMDLETYYERSLFLEKGYEEMIERALNFYKLTFERDQYFLDQALSKMDQENQTKAALITGGFHTTNLKELLKKKNISYISITPQALQETNLKKYESILLNQIQDIKTPQLTMKPSMSTAMPVQLAAFAGGLPVQAGARLALDDLAAGNPLLVLEIDGRTANQRALLDHLIRREASGLVVLPATPDVVSEPSLDLTVPVIDADLLRMGSGNEAVSPNKVATTPVQLSRKDREVLEASASRQREARARKPGQVFRGDIIRNRGARLSEYDPSRFLRALGVDRPDTSSASSAKDRPKWVPGNSAANELAGVEAERFVGFQQTVDRFEGAWNSFRKAFFGARLAGEKEDRGSWMVDGKNPTQSTIHNPPSVAESDLSGARLASAIVWGVAAVTVFTGSFFLFRKFLSKYDQIPAALAKPSIVRFTVVGMVTSQIPVAFLIYQMSKIDSLTNLPSPGSAEEWALVEPIFVAMITGLVSAAWLLAPIKSYARVQFWQNFSNAVSMQRRGDLDRLEQINQLLITGSIFKKVIRFYFPELEDAVLRAILLDIVQFDLAVRNSVHHNSTTSLRFLLSRLADNLDRWPYGRLPSYVFDSNSYQSMASWLEQNPDYISELKPLLTRVLLDPPVLDSKAGARLAGSPIIATVRFSEEAGTRKWVNGEVSIVAPLQGLDEFTQRRIDRWMGSTQFDRNAVYALLFMAGERFGLAKITNSLPTGKKIEVVPFVSRESWTSEDVLRVLALNLRVHDQALSQPELLNPASNIGLNIKHVIGDAYTVEIAFGARLAGKERSQSQKVTKPQVGSRVTGDLVTLSPDVAASSGARLAENHETLLNNFFGSYINNNEAIHYNDYEGASGRVNLSLKRVNQDVPYQTSPGIFISKNYSSDGAFTIIIEYNPSQEGYHVSRLLYRISGELSRLVIVSNESEPVWYVESSESFFKNWKNLFFNIMFSSLHETDRIIDSATMDAYRDWERRLGQSEEQESLDASAQTLLAAIKNNYYSHPSFRDQWKINLLVELFESVFNYARMSRLKPRGVHDYWNVLGRAPAGAAVSSEAPVHAGISSDTETSSRSTPPWSTISGLFAHQNNLTPTELVTLLESARTKLMEGGFQELWVNMRLVDSRTKVITDTLGGSGLVELGKFLASQEGGAHRYQIVSDFNDTRTPDFNATNYYVFIKQLPVSTVGARLADTRRENPVQALVRRLLRQPEVLPSAELDRVNISRVRAVLNAEPDQNIVGILVSRGQNELASGEWDYLIIKKDGNAFFMIPDEAISDYRLRDELQKLGFLNGGPLSPIILADTLMAVTMFLATPAKMKGIQVFGADNNRPVMPDWTVIARSKKLDAEITAQLEKDIRQAESGARLAARELLGERTVYEQVQAVFDAFDGDVTDSYGGVLSAPRNDLASRLFILGVPQDDIFDLAESFLSTDLSVHDLRDSIEYILEDSPIELTDEVIEKILAEIFKQMTTQSGRNFETFSASVDALTKMLIGLGDTAEDASGNAESLMDVHPTYALINHVVDTLRDYKDDALDWQYVSDDADSDGEFDEPVSVSAPAAFDQSRSSAATYTSPSYQGTEGLSANQVVTGFLVLGGIGAAVAYLLSNSEQREMIWQFIQNIKFNFFGARLAVTREQMAEIHAIAEEEAALDSVARWNSTDARRDREEQSRASERNVRMAEEERAERRIDDWKARRHRGARIEVLGARLGWWDRFLESVDWLVGSLADSWIVEKRIEKAASLGIDVTFETASLRRKSGVLIYGGLKTGDFADIYVQLGRKIRHHSRAVVPQGARLGVTFFGHPAGFLEKWSLDRVMGVVRRSIRTKATFEHDPITRLSNVFQSGYTFYDDNDKYWEVAVEHGEGDRLKALTVRTKKSTPSLDGSRRRDVQWFEKEFLLVFGSRDELLARQIVSELSEQALGSSLREQETQYRVILNGISILYANNLSSLLSQLRYYGYRVMLSGGSVVINDEHVISGDDISSEDIQSILDLIQFRNDVKKVKGWAGAMLGWAADYSPAEATYPAFILFFKVNARQILTKWMLRAQGIRAPSSIGSSVRITNLEDYSRFGRDRRRVHMESPLMDEIHQLRGARLSAIPNLWQVIELREPNPALRKSGYFKVGDIIGVHISEEKGFTEKALLFVTSLEALSAFRVYVKRGQVFKAIVVQNKAEDVAGVVRFAYLGQDGLPLAVKGSPVQGRGSVKDPSIGKWKEVAPAGDDSTQSSPEEEKTPENFLRTVRDSGVIGYKGREFTIGLGYARKQVKIIEVSGGFEIQTPEGVLIKRYTLTDKGYRVSTKGPSPIASSEPTGARLARHYQQTSDGNFSNPNRLPVIIYAESDNLIEVNMRHDLMDHAERLGVLIVRARSLYAAIEAAKTAGKKLKAIVSSDQLAKLPNEEGLKATIQKLEHPLLGPRDPAGANAVKELVYRAKNTLHVPVAVYGEEAFAGGAFSTPDQSLIFDDTKYMDEKIAEFIRTSLGARLAGRISTIALISLAAILPGAFVAANAGSWGSWQVNGVLALATILVVAGSKRMFLPSAPSNYSLPHASVGRVYTAEEVRILVLEVVASVAKKDAPSVAVDTNLKSLGLGEAELRDIADQIDLRVVPDGGVSFSLKADQTAWRTPQDIIHTLESYLRASSQLEGARLSYGVEGIQHKTLNPVLKTELAARIDQLISEHASNSDSKTRQVNIRVDEFGNSRPILLAAASVQRGKTLGKETLGRKAASAVRNAGPFIITELSATEYLVTLSGASSKTRGEAAQFYQIYIPGAALLRVQKSVVAGSKEYVRGTVSFTRHTQGPDQVIEVPYELPASETPEQSVRRIAHYLTSTFNLWDRMYGDLSKGPELLNTMPRDYAMPQGARLSEETQKERSLLSQWLTSVAMDHLTVLDRVAFAVWQTSRILGLGFFVIVGGLFISGPGIVLLIPIAFMLEKVYTSIDFMSMFAYKWHVLRFLGYSSLAITVFSSIKFLLQRSNEADSSGEKIPINKTGARLAGEVSYPNFVRELELFVAQSAKDDRILLYLMSILDKYETIPLLSRSRDELAEALLDISQRLAEVDAPRAMRWDAADLVRQIRLLQGYKQGDEFRAQLSDAVGIVSRLLPQQNIRLRANGHRWAIIYPGMERAEALEEKVDSAAKELLKRLYGLTEADYDKVALKADAYYSELRIFTSNPWLFRALVTKERVPEALKKAAAYLASRGIKKITVSVKDGSITRAQEFDLRDFWKIEYYADGLWGGIQSDRDAIYAVSANADGSIAFQKIHHIGVPRKISSATLTRAQENISAQRASSSQAPQVVRAELNGSNVYELRAGAEGKVIGRVNQADKLATRLNGWVREGVLPSLQFEASFARGSWFLAIKDDRGERTSVLADDYPAVAQMINQMIAGSSAAKRIAEEPVQTVSIPTQVAAPVTASVDLPLFVLGADYVELAKTLVQEAVKSPDVKISFVTPYGQAVNDIASLGVLRYQLSSQMEAGAHTNDLYSRGLPRDPYRFEATSTTRTKPELDQILSSLVRILREGGAIEGSRLSSDQDLADLSRRALKERLLAALGENPRIPVDVDAYNSYPQVTSIITDQASVEALIKSLADRHPRDLVYLNNPDGADLLGLHVSFTNTPVDKGARLAGSPIVVSIRVSEAAGTIKMVDGVRSIVAPLEDLDEVTQRRINRWMGSTRPTKDAVYALIVIGDVRLGLAKISNATPRGKYVEVVPFVSRTEWTSEQVLRLLALSLPVHDPSITEMELLDPRSNMNFNVEAVTSDAYKVTINFGARLSALTQSSTLLQTEASSNLQNMEKDRFKAYLDERGVFAGLVRGLDKNDVHKPVSVLARIVSGMVLSYELYEEVSAADDSVVKKRLFFRARPANHPFTLNIALPTGEAARDQEQSLAPFLMGTHDFFYFIGAMTLDSIADEVKAKGRVSELDRTIEGLLASYSLRIPTAAPVTVLQSAEVVKGDSVTPRRAREAVSRSDDAERFRNRTDLILSYVATNEAYKKGFSTAALAHDTKLVIPAYGAVAQTSNLTGLSSRYLAIHKVLSWALTNGRIGALPDSSPQIYILKDVKASEVGARLAGKQFGVGSSEFGAREFRASRVNVAGLFGRASENLVPGALVSGALGEADGAREFRGSRLSVAQLFGQKSKSLSPTQSPVTSHQTPVAAQGNLLRQVGGFLVGTAHAGLVTQPSQSISILLDPSQATIFELSLNRDELIVNLKGGEKLGVLSASSADVERNDQGIPQSVKVDVAEALSLLNMSSQSMESALSDRLANIETLTPTLLIAHLETFGDIRINPITLDAFILGVSQLADKLNKKGNRDVLRVTLYSRDQELSAIAGARLAALQKKHPFVVRSFVLKTTLAGFIAVNALVPGSQAAEASQRLLPVQALQPGDVFSPALSTLLSVGIAQEAQGQPISDSTVKGFEVATGIKADRGELQEVIFDGTKLSLMQKYAIKPILQQISQYLQVLKMQMKQVAQAA